MKEFIEKLIGRLEELCARNDKTKKMAYEEQDWEKFDLFTHRCEGIYSAIAIVNQLAEEYEPCNKTSCKDCEVYDKEKHYCPKWCEVIKHTTSELAEEHNNDFCEWKFTKSVADGGYFYSSGCNHKRFSDLYSFEFCPYCGKKIKVVETAPYKEGE